MPAALITCMASVPGAVIFDVKLHWLKDGQSCA
jgi:hypothetical protein